MERSSDTETSLNSVLFGYNMFCLFLFCSEEVLEAKDTVLSAAGPHLKPIGCAWVMDLPQGMESL